MTTIYKNMDVSDIGPDATEADLAEFLELCGQVQELHPEMTEAEVAESVWGDGDYFRNAQRLGATLRE